MLNGKMTTVIYFEDVQLGMLAVLWSFSPPETKYVRFTGRPMPQGWKP